MATGDDALAAGMDLVSGSALANTLDTEENKTRDYIAQRTSTVTPVAKGGTGGTTAAAARTGLGLGSASTQDAVSYVTNQQAPGQAIGLNFTGGRLIPQVGGTILPGLLNVGDGVPNEKVSKTGDTMTGDLYVPNATAANSGFTIAYINSDGRLSKGSSSERYKKNITDVDPTSLGEIFPGVVRYKMRSGSSDSSSDEEWHYGWIAERLAESDATRPFVVYDTDGQVESIDFIGLLIIQTASLHVRVLALEAR